jgi:hypothetical protein
VTIVTYIDKPTFGSKELGKLLAEYDNSNTEIISADPAQEYAY